MLRTARLLPLLSLALIAVCEDPRETMYRAYHARVASVGELDDATVLRYVRAYRQLRAAGIDFQTSLAGGDPAHAHASLDKIVRAEGFSDLTEFVKVNAKIAWAWNMAQARSGLQSQRAMNAWGLRKFDAGLAEIDAALRDPAVPGATKTELRKTRAELEAGRAQLKATFEKNLPWAEWALRFAAPLTNEREIEVVLRHEKELMRVFTGLSEAELDAVHEHSMRFLRE